MSGETSLGVTRGLRLRCPNCGDAPLFFRYLKVAPTCPNCGHDNGRYPADDAPAYLTILLVGHLVIAPMLVFEFVWTWPTWIVIATTLPALAILSLLVLPRMKGAVVGIHWAMQMHKPHV